MARAFLAEPQVNPALHFVGQTLGLVDGNDDEVGRRGFLGGNLLQFAQAKGVEQPDMLNDLTLLAQITRKTLAELLYPHARDRVLEDRQKSQPLRFFPTLPHLRAVDPGDHNKSSLHGNLADEIAKHGAGASTFSDWWAYKFEVYDAIPYNGSLLRDRGVVVAFNSDSSELARRLYTEAAKAVKYGGTPESEALKFVTINPARQLRMDQRVGSLEPGKDADFGIWSKPPLDSGTVCIQTWIEGKKYFDRSLNAERTARLEQERTDLLAKAKKLAKLSAGGDDGGGGGGGDDSFFRVSLEHEFDGRDRHCLEE